MNKEIEDMYLDCNKEDLGIYGIGVKEHEEAYMKAFNIACDNAIKSKHSIQDTLDERQSTHGKFTTQALISQSMKKRARDGKNWNSMDADMREAIDMILHKIARIVNGDQYHIDSWHDISGYATLVENRLEE